MPLILFNKPFRVLSQFSDSQGRPVLSDYITDHTVYPAGRLDYDSEGLLLLTDDGRLQASISQPAARLPKHYWVQVEGLTTAAQLNELINGIRLKDGPARAIEATLIAEPPDLPIRTPPIRSRRNVPTSWLNIVINEGRNRQVRRMTAAAGLPTLRLIRHRVGPWELGSLEPGQQITFSLRSAWQLLDCWRQERLA